MKDYKSIQLVITSRILNVQLLTTFTIQKVGWAPDRISATLSNGNEARRHYKKPGSDKAQPDKFSHFFLQVSP